MAKKGDLLEEAADAFQLLGFDEQQEYVSKLQGMMQEAKAAKVAELMAQLQALGVSPTPAKRARSTGEGKGNRQSPPVKYRDPASGAGWSGRGRPAAWLQKYIDDGRDKSEFLIQD